MIIYKFHPPLFFQINCFQYFNKRIRHRLSSLRDMGELLILVCYLYKKNLIIWLTKDKKIGYIAE